MMQKCSYVEFSQHYDLWLADCLSEYNEKFGENRKYVCIPEVEYDSWELVEFGEDGSAYPHGVGGTNCIMGAVTPWEKSPHYIR